MAWISLPLRVRLPIRIARVSATMQRIPAEQAFNKADRRNYEEEDESQNDSGRHERESFRQCHPCFVWQNEGPSTHPAQNDNHAANTQPNMRPSRKLPPA